MGDLKADYICDSPKCNSVKRDMIAEYSDIIKRLHNALNDSINSPKGVVPKSAEEFYDGKTGKIIGL